MWHIHFVGLINVVVVRGGPTARISPFFPFLVSAGDAVGCSDSTLYLLYLQLIIRG